jgi:uncharacterized protein (TIRG00374 family)
MQDSPTQPSPPPEDEKPRRKWLSRVLLFLLGLAIFAALIYFAGWESLDKVAQPNLAWLAGGMLGIAFMLYLVSQRWGGLADSLAGRPAATPFEYYFYGVSSMALGTFLPQTASVVVVRSAALNRIGKLSLRKSVTSVLLDKLFDAFMMLVFAVPALLLVFEVVTLRWAFWIALIVFALVSALIVGRYQLWLRLMQGLVSFAVGLVRRVPFLKRFSQLQAIERLENLEEWDILQRKTILRAYWLTAGAQIALAARSWMIARAVGLDISPIAIFMGIALVQASLLIALTPGALGVAEAAWYIALAGSGVPPDMIAAFLVAHRVYQSIAIALTWLGVYLASLVTHRPALAGVMPGGGATLGQGQPEPDLEREQI